MSNGPQRLRNANIRRTTKYQETPMSKGPQRSRESNVRYPNGPTFKETQRLRDHYFPGTPTSKGPKLQYATSKGLQCSSEPNVWETPTPKGPQHPRDPNIWRTSKFKEIQPLSNQIYLVTLRPTQFDTSFIFTKKSNVAKCIFDISNAEMAQWCQKSWNLDIQSLFSMSKNVWIFLKKFHWRLSM